MAGHVKDKKRGRLATGSQSPWSKLLEQLYTNTPLLSSPVFKNPVHSTLNPTQPCVHVVNPTVDRMASSIAIVVHFGQQGIGMLQFTRQKIQPVSNLGFLLDPLFSSFGTCALMSVDLDQS